MLEKRKRALDNPDVVIAGRHIEFVTGYSVDSCVHRLQYLKEGVLYVGEHLYESK